MLGLISIADLGYKEPVLGDRRYSMQGHAITSNYRQIRLHKWRMSFVASSIVEASMNKIAL